ncbi:MULTISPECIES: hypothetical protein [Methylobacterium]|uniref:hypothetical protein n=1 Tax=Methylobacterium TaxID=407 RepID=UPI001EE34467|nr:MULTISPECIES: hypothetical protein [Methylobacterium]
MSVYFIVSAKQESRSVSFERRSMTDALDTAMTLLASGRSDVSIAHPDGRRSTPASFLADCLGSPKRETRRAA